VSTEAVIAPGQRLEGHADALEGRGQLNDLAAPLAGLLVDGPGVDQLKAPLETEVPTAPPASLLLETVRHDRLQARAEAKLDLRLSGLLGATARHQGLQ
jgi:hypothetical protein